MDAGSGKALGQIVKENSKSAGAAYVDTVALQHFSGKWKKWIIDVCTP